MLLHLLQIYNTISLESILKPKKFPSFASFGSSQLTELYNNVYISCSVLPTWSGYPSKSFLAGCGLLCQTTAHWRRCSEPSETFAMKVDPRGSAMPSSFWSILFSALPSVETMPQRYNTFTSETLRQSQGFCLFLQCGCLATSESLAQTR